MDEVVLPVRLRGTQRRHWLRSKLIGMRRNRRSGLSESVIGISESAIGMSESVIGIRRNRDRLESESGFALEGALACLIADHRLSGIQAASDHPSLFHGHQS